MRVEPPLTSGNFGHVNVAMSPTVSNDDESIFDKYSHYDIILYAEVENIVLPLFCSLKTNLFEERVSIKSKIGKSQVGDLIPISLSNSSYVFKVIKKKT